ncbi:MAG: polyprenol monophosphomannose synthase [Bacteroidetes bacterium]|nr:polyprenol monophosphomannose synthase [Bacteroidota bacterium]
MSANALVIIPTYNEIENISQMVPTVMALPSSFDLLIVDDGSPDGTAQAVRRLMAQYPGRVFLEERSGKQGLGTAYLHGFRWGLARDYTWLFEMDADFSHNPADLERLLDACREQGYDMSIGSRYVNGVNVVNWPMGRVLMSYFASVYVRLITGMPFRDATAGFKCYHRQVLKAILAEPVKFVGYAFQIEMKFKAWQQGFRITEVPIIFTERVAGASKMTSGIVQEAIWGVIWLTVRGWFQKNNR